MAKSKPGKTSIAKKAQDSKNKRLFKQRSRGRQVKKNRKLDHQQAEFVTNLEKIKQKKLELAQRMGVKVAMPKESKKHSDSESEESRPEEEDEVSVLSAGSEEGEMEIDEAP
jgi:hypothetical protein